MKSTKVLKGMIEEVPKNQKNTESTAYHMTQKILSAIGFITDYIAI